MLYLPSQRAITNSSHSNFWVGLYSQTWLNNLQLCIGWVSEWMRSNRNKRLYPQRGLQAIDLIEPAF